MLQDNIDHHDSPWRGASFGLLFYDVQYPPENFKSWIREFEMYTPPFLRPELIVVGNKIDCTPHIPPNVQTLLDRGGNISIKTGAGLDRLWEYIHKQIVAKSECVGLIRTRKRLEIEVNDQVDFRELDFLRCQVRVLTQQYVYDAVVAAPSPSLGFNETADEATTTNYTPAPPPRRGGVPRIEAVIRARDQFVAVATGALVGRCGVGSPVTAAWSRGTIASLWEFGRSWVLCPSTPIGMTLLSRDTQTVWGPAKVHVSMGLSPTLGVVYCECLESVPASMAEALCHVVGAIGRNRLVMEGIFSWSVVDGPGGNPRMEQPLKGGHVVCSQSWVVRKTARSLALWKVHEGEPQEDDPLHTASAKFRAQFLHISGDTLAMWGGSRKRSRVCSGRAVFVDLQKTYTSNAVSIIDQWEFPGLTCDEVVGALPICTLQTHNIGKGDLVVSVHHHHHNSSAITFRNSTAICFAGENKVWVTHRGPPIKHCFYNLGDTSTPIFSCDQVAALSMHIPPRQGVIPVQVAPLEVVFVDINTGSHLAVLSL
ncbi:hypothetical protein Pelo_2757 [Pelomyxa schiedti]|nr:hypothetical protein Pelo_2757 [Pelomyxa schiedti]